MAIFNKFYATYYDFLYKGKDYSAEADFFTSLIKKYGLKDTKSILSFGAGTLNHEQFLLKKGYEIDGVEISKDMFKFGVEKIKKNKLKSISISMGDMRNFSSKKKYDAVLVMFNSVAYCRGLSDMDRFIKSVSSVMKKDGVLIFDCWNAEVAQKDPPQNTWSKIKIENRNLYKLIESSKMNSDNSFTRTAELIVLEGDKVIGKQSEKHKLYTWKVEDIKKIISKYALELLIVSDFMNIKPINNTRWNMVIVLKKK